MEIRRLRTEADYQAALADIEQYFDNEPKRGTALIKAYEAKKLLIK